MQSISVKQYICKQYICKTNNMQIISGNTALPDQWSPV